MDSKKYICKKSTIVMVLHNGNQSNTVIHKGNEVDIVFLHGCAFGRLFYCMSGEAENICGMLPETTEPNAAELHLHMHPDEPLLNNFELMP